MSPTEIDVTPDGDVVRVTLEDSFVQADTLGARTGEPTSRSEIPLADTATTGYLATALESLVVLSPGCPGPPVCRSAGSTRRPGT